ncbi:DUF3934 family protein [Paenibacillus phytohabitans]|uniref:DUF3934 family protein n=1 Tax=Paenibacillus phytohabitans TaxID=2654978 RepID=UPI00300ADEE5
MVAKSKGGGTGRGTGSKGWTRWNKTAKPVKPAKSGPPGSPGTKPGTKGAGTAKVSSGGNKTGGSK